VAEIGKYSEIKAIFLETIPALAWTEQGKKLEEFNVHRTVHR